MVRPAGGRALLERTTEWLGRTPGILRAHVRGQARETMDRRPGGGAWSQTEILAHLADFEVVCFQGRVERILRGEPIRSLDPDARAAEVPYAAIHPVTALGVFERERERSLDRIRRLSPVELERRAVHDERGEMSLARLLSEWVDHDLAHVRQLVTTAAQILRPGAEAQPPVSRVGESPARAAESP